MTIKSRIGIILGIFLSIYIWRMWQQKDSPSPQREPAPVSKRVISKQVMEPKEIPTSPPLQNIEPVKKTPLAPETPLPGGVYRTKNDWVEFRVEGDLAIAFGDVVLGKVKDPKMPVGRIRPNKPRLWDSEVIPYHIDESLPNKDRVREVLDYFHQDTVMRFTPFAGEEDALVFKAGADHCASYLGRVGGHQPIFLSEKCSFNEIVHEIMHALGFVHEHSRPERDRYVQIVWDNVLPEFWPQFAIVPDTMVHDYAGSVFDFDFHSVMLYGPNFFSIDPVNKPTMISKTKAPIEPVKRGLSEVDKERLYYLYGR